MSHLDDRHALALAELLTILLCGEDSAVQTFDGLSSRITDQLLSSELGLIAEEERVHRDLVHSIVIALPSASMDVGFTAACRGFFRRLASRDPGVHLSRVIALDSAVCMILGATREVRMLRATGLQPIFQRIHADEGRHVAIARKYACELASRETRFEAFVDTRIRLIELLERRAPAFETLAIDYTRLSRQLRFVSRSLVS